MSLVSVQLDPDGPIIAMDETLLVRTSGLVDDDRERTTWVEYRLATDPNAARAVHRSVHVTLKKSVSANGEFGKVGT